MVRCAKTSYVITYGYDALGRQTRRLQGQVCIASRGKVKKLCIEVNAVAARM